MGPLVGTTRWVVLSYADRHDEIAAGTHQSSGITQSSIPTYRRAHLSLPRGFKFNYADMKYYNDTADQHLRPGQPGSTTTSLDSV